ncbi:MAG TPA: ABC transporter ATP-binding protein [Polyangiaceae bacterium]|nr:ABC transporter ATP-binding protein [Polyangiaceae bacterium]
MLDAKRRLVFVILVISLFLAGCFEMAGMLVIFGFISGLKPHPGTDDRAGVVSRALHLFVDEPLTDEQYALLGGSLVIAVIVAKNAQALVVRHQLSRFLANLNRRITETLFAGFLMAPYIDLKTEKHGHPELVVRGNMEVVSACFKDAAQVLADGTMLLMVILLLLFIDPWLTLGAALLFGVAGTLTFRALSVRLREMGRVERLARHAASRYLSESLRALIETRLRDNTRYYVNRFRSALRDQLNTQRSVQALARVPRAANEVLLAVGVTGAVIYVIVSGRDLTTFLPTLAVFGFAGLRSNGAMSRINASLQSLRRRAEAFDSQRQALLRIAPRVFQDEVELDAPPSYLADEVDTNGTSQLTFSKDLVLENVSFCYPESDTPAVRELSLRIEAGSFVSFCGESGGGKSTLLLLLMGMVQPTSGRILCDGKDVRHHVRAWHRQLGYVGQDLFLSNTSVRNNVALGVLEKRIDDSAVERALREAAAWDFVAALPQGPRTIIRNNGSRLSGGQRQRVVIARALYHDPTVLIFDEATSALDAATEKLITGALVGLRRTKTVICVAHRLSSIRASDEIFVMRAGRIVEHGSYDELIERSEYFRQLANEFEKAVD